ncbi:Fic family protein [Paludibaculum fermentans]|uniref:Fic family protein n=1 Tax=Paludibaculum fermentans TaxID=1473598 RepID=UPI003EBD7268
MIGPIGLMGLLQELQLSDVEPPFVRSEVRASARRTVESQDLVLETYPQTYACGTLQKHLQFALRHEPLDLRVWHRVMDALPAQVVTGWVSGQPNSKYAQRAWYLYERLTGNRLPLNDSRAPFADLADGDLQIVLRSSRYDTPLSQRHHIRENLLGPIEYCPLVRRSKALKERGEKNYGTEARALTLGLDPLLFRRAADYLYRSETRSSYAIEGETPAPGREERFLAVLAQAGRQEVAGELELVRLQNEIVQDRRFAATGWRTIQNYVGRTRVDYSEDVRYVCPKPEDLPELMKGWTDLVARIAKVELGDVVPLAACVAFGFVYLHPFEDGNGRLHRFLIHHILAAAQYTPEGIIFPVSAAIQRRMKEYDAVLETVSRLVNPGVRYELDADNRMAVQNATGGLYRYPDLTRHAEFLYECIEETLRKDWPEELRFLQLFDGAYRDTQAVVELPDTRLRLLVKLLLQNNGHLAKGKRQMFAVVTDDELGRIEEAVVRRMVQIGESGMEPDPTAQSETAPRITRTQ